ncbi:MAG: wax ester/triacylglycerol synthase family O-acyltransferase [Acidimicrobiales bacterium]|nr:wax ester/triacylglycerol synthase family O-acyltransferase [Acidimicrobiales bacterium]
MQQMSGQDAAFLYCETPNWHMHISGLIIIDPSSHPDGWDFPRFRDLLVARLHEIPQFRYRLVDVPFGLDRPGWTEDPDLDIDYHVRRIGVPRPGDQRELGALVGRLCSYKLNRQKPLWECWVIEGLEGGRVALLTKIHHSLVDGVSGAGLAEILLDLTPEPREPDPEVRDSLVGQHVPSQLELLARGSINTAIRTPYRVARFARQSMQQIAAALPLATGSAVTLPLQAPRTSLNVDPTPHRSFASASVELDRLKALKTAYDVKINDIILALCGSAMRSYLLDIDDLPDTPLTAQVPVSMRVDGDGSVGNKVGAMTCSLATDQDDPACRLMTIHASTHAAKEMRQAMAVHQIMGVTETTPPGLIALAARMYTRRGLARFTPPASNVVISNVPGPPFPLYVTGGTVESIFAMGPLLMGMSLNITVFSYRDNVDVGIMVCPESVPDPFRITDGIEPAVAELEKAAPS